MDNVWKVSEPVRALQQARTFVNNHKKIVFGIAGVATVAAIFFFRNKKDDTPVFEKTLTELNAVEEQAVSQMARLPIADMPKAAVLLKDSTLPIWQAFRQQLKRTEKLQLDESLEEKRKLLTNYADLRVQQAKLLYSAFQENSNAYDSELSRVYNEINDILSRLQN
jgi:hypothetical protein